MEKSAGRTLSLTVPRELICDLLHFAQQTPTVPVQREMDLGGLVEVRSQLARPVSWSALFTKAYGQVAARVPELRRAYLSFPNPRLYEHPCSIAAVAVERLVEGDNAILFAEAQAPEGQTLRQLDDHLRSLWEGPVLNFGLFRRALRLRRLPRWVRRLLWQYDLNTSGVRRARLLGTFSVSAHCGRDAEPLYPLSPVTTTLHYGTLRRDELTPVRITYDHRVMDGATVARALALLEDVLNGDMAAELRETEAAVAA